jgi:RHS repeat-associated protein
MAKASGALSPRRVLTTAVDAYSYARLLPLAFSRLAPVSVDQRFRLGPLGRGWSHNYEYSLESPELARVIIREPGGSARTFTRYSGSAWQAEPGDFGVLAKQADSSYLLREKDGVTLWFTAAGALGWVQEPNGNRLTLAYDGSGRLTNIGHSNGEGLALSYNGSGRIASLTDSAGQVTRYYYDGSGEHLQSVVELGGPTTSYTYVSGPGSPTDHALAAIAYPDGTHRYYAYDTTGRIIEESRDEGAEHIQFAYDPSGDVLVTDATGATSILSLGASGEPLSVADPLGRAAAFTYGVDGSLTRVIGPDGGSSSLTYDGLGNPRGVTDPLGQSLTLGSTTPFGALDWLRDANGRLTDYASDSRGNLTGITYPDGSTEAFSYDAAGELVSVTNRRGQAITYSYNALGRVARKRHPDGRTVDYTYDARGNLTSAADSVTGKVLMQYDARDFLASIEYPNGMWFSFEYNDAGRRTRRTGDDGYILNYSYDNAGRLSSITDGAGNQVVSYAYDAVGRLSLETKGNGTYTTYEYDAAGQLLSMMNYAPDGTVQSAFGYTYDVNGNRTSVATPAGTTSYGYDATGQLTGVTYPDGRSVTYEYDPAGNRVTVTDSGAATEYVTNAMNQYTQVGATTYGYDSDGNMTSKTDASGTATYQYDAENRLVRVVTPADGAWEYVYDALGNRIAVAHGGTATWYLHDPIGLVDVAAEYDDAGALVARYAHGLGLIARTDAAGSLAYYSFDAIGHTRQLTDPSGAVINSYDYDPFGIPLQASETVPNPFQYVGRFGVMEEGNGLTFMRARYYEAGVGRFISEDPLGTLGGVNLSAYAQNSPVGYVDPLGLVRRWDFFWASVDAVSGAAGVCAAGMAVPFTGGASLLPLVASAYATGVGIGNMYNAWIDVPPALGGGLFGDIGKLSTNLTVQSLGRLVDTALVANRFPSIAARASFRGTRGWVQDTLKCLKLGRSVTSLAWGIARALEGDQPTNSSASATSTVVRSYDPNEKTGPPGYDQQRWVPREGGLTYTIYFENQASATAPAQEIAITDQLSADLDWSTFHLGEIAFGSQVVGDIADLSSGSAEVPLSGSSLIVQIEAGINTGTGRAEWRLRAVDPLTGELPEDPLAGLLPPNNPPDGRGEGHVTFTVRPKASAATGDVITNSASIVFDVNEPIATAEVFNTVDVGPPSSQVSALPSQSPTQFVVSWSGTDDAGGSAVQDYTIYVSDNNWGYQPWRTETTDTYGVFYGQTGHTYRFYSVARDNVGYEEAAPAQPDATTTVSSVHTITVSAGASSPMIDNAGSVSLTASATDSAGHTITQWRWSDHGAGGSFAPGSTTRNPTWQAPGNFSGSPVERRLTVTAICGSSPSAAGSADAVVTEEPLHVLSVSALADWSVLQSEGETQLSAMSQDSFGDGVASWQWDDGGAGGTFSPAAQVQNPSYTAPGNLSETDLGVTLTVTATCAGADPLTATESLLLTVRPASHLLSVAVQPDSASVASGGAISVEAECQDSRAHAIASWSWSEPSLHRASERERQRSSCETDRLRGLCWSTSASHRWIRHADGAAGAARGDSDGPSPRPARCRLRRRHATRCQSCGQPRWSCGLPVVLGRWRRGRELQSLGHGGRSDLHRPSQPDRRQRKHCALGRRFLSDLSAGGSYADCGAGGATGSPRSGRRDRLSQSGDGGFRRQRLACGRGLGQSPGT